MKEFGESLNIKNFNDNAEYFENKSQFINGLDQMLIFIPRKDVEDFKTSFYNNIISKINKENVNEAAEFLRLGTFKIYEDVEKMKNEADKEAKNQYMVDKLKNMYDIELNRIDEEINDIDFNTLKNELKKKLKQYYNYFDTEYSIYEHLRELMDAILSDGNTDRIKIKITKNIIKIDEYLENKKHEQTQLKKDQDAEIKQLKKEARIKREKEEQLKRGKKKKSN